MNKSQVGKGFAWNVAFTVIGKMILPIAITIALGRILGPANWGIFAALGSFLAILDLFRDFGIGQNYIVDREADEHRAGQYFTLTVGLAVVMAGLLMACSPFIAEFLKIQESSLAILVMAFATIGTGISTVPGGTLQKQAKFKEWGLIDVSAQAISGVASLIMAAQGMGFWALVWAAPIRTFLTAAAFYYLAPAKFAMPDAPFLRSIARKCAATLSNSLLSVAYTMGDNALVKPHLGAISAGHYIMSFNLAMKPVEVVAWPLGRTLIVAFSEHRNDYEKLRRAYARALAAILLAVGPLYLLLGVYGTEIITLLFGPDFAPGGVTLSILSLYLFARSLGTLSGSMIFALGVPGLSNYGWIAAWTVVGTGIATQQIFASLETFAWWFTAGALIAYGWTILACWWKLKPRRKDARSLINAAVVNAAAAAVVFAFRGSLGPGLVSLLVGASLGLLTAFVAASLVFTGRIATSRSGLKEIWNAL